MTDNELQKALYEAWRNSRNSIAGWLAVARKARELLDPSELERAVIEAADAWEICATGGDPIPGHYSDTTKRMVAAVRALRAKQPKPRFRTSAIISGAVEDTKTGHVYIGSQVLALLNEFDQQNP